MEVKGESMLPYLTVTVFVYIGVWKLVGKGEGGASDVNEPPRSACDGVSTCNGYGMSSGIR